MGALKRIVDEDPTPGRFILTGSVEPATYGPTYPLTGRAAHLTMRPMNRSELNGTGRHPTFLDDVLAGEGPIPSAGRTSAFTLAWLRESGFPGARGMDDPSLLLDAYAGTGAQRAGDEGRDATRMLRTMRVLASVEGQAVPDQRTWDAADINKATWKAHDDLLQRVHLAVPVPSLESNRLKRLTTYPTRFLADTAMALTLADLNAGRLASDPRLAGRYLESLVKQQLRPQVDALRGHLSHVRTGAGEREVDAVVEIGDQLIAFEVKHAARVSGSDAHQLAWLRDQVGSRFHSGFVSPHRRGHLPLG